MQEALISALSRMLGATVVHAEAQTRQLQGGTLGDVQLVSGMAKTADNKTIPYQIVWKKQKKWERPGDPDSWRREYDLYASDLASAFSDSFRWPACYHAEINEAEGEIQLWMEYIEGASGEKLTAEMLELSAFELGRFQGKHLAKPGALKEIGCLGGFGFMEREFGQWHRQTFTYEFLTSAQCRMPEFLKQMLKAGDIELVDGKSLEYAYLRSRACAIPEHLKQMLMDIDKRRDEIFGQIRRLPVVLCHRDFWIENIFVQDGKVRLIDWDTAGFGYLGEDIASLIVDETDADSIHNYYRQLIPAYVKGLSEIIDIPQGEALHIHEMILIKFGYRILQGHMFSECSEVKARQVDILQRLYEVK